MVYSHAVVFFSPAVVGMVTDAYLLADKAGIKPYPHSLGDLFATELCSKLSTLGSLIEFTNIEFTV